MIKAKKILSIFLLSLLIFMNSCSTEDESDLKVDHMVFGHFYGFCVGEECIEIFKLTPYNIFEDKNDLYPEYDSSYDGDYELLSSDKFLLAKHLLNIIPQKLFDEEDHIIGQPDAGDWGGIYIEIQKDGITEFWLIDKLIENIPSYLHDFMIEINKSIDLMQ